MNLRWLLIAVLMTGLGLGAVIGALITHGARHGQAIECRDSDGPDGLPRRRCQRDGGDDR